MFSGNARDFLCSLAFRPGIIPAVFEIPQKVFQLGTKETRKR